MVYGEMLNPKTRAKYHKDSSENIISLYWYFSPPTKKKENQVTPLILTSFKNVIKETVFASKIICVFYKNKIIW